MIADDFEFAKFHSPSAPEVLAKLIASVSEVFLCLLPDVDDGFEFFYWRDGALVRSYQKRSTDWGDSYEVEEQGVPLPAETEPLTGVDEATERVWVIARSLNFDLIDSLDSYRVLAGPNYPLTDLDGPVLSNVSRELMNNPILGPHLNWQQK